jgi:hypothetical protein
MLSFKQGRKEGSMAGRTTQMAVVASVSLMAFWSFAIGQTGSSQTNWDPIHGFSDGSPAGSAVSSSYGGNSSLWSAYQPVDIPTSRPDERPATLGGIVVSGGSRRCGGLFRVVNC